MPAETTLQTSGKISSSEATNGCIEVAKPHGLEWWHVNGAHGQKYFPETMGSGVIDWDNDSDPDLVFNNGTHWPEDSTSKKKGRLLKMAFVTLPKKLVSRSWNWATGDFDGDGHLTQWAKPSHEKC